MNPGGQLPRRIGDFLLLGEIGRGASGMVWYARRVSIGRPCALKLLLGGRDASDSDRARLQLEAAAASSLDHPAIVRVYGAGEVDGQPYIEMELLSGETMADRLASGPHSPMRAAEWIRTLAEGLAHAHSRGVLHRDIKPSNILMCEDGSVKLGDFGFARILTSCSDLTLTLGIVGTPMYLAPEIARHGAAATTTASDIFSLGAVFSEMLTGCTPRRGSDPLEILSEIQQSPILTPSLVRSEVPRDLDVICQRCIADEPRGRFSTAGEVAEELTRYLRREPIRSRPISIGERLLLWARRHRLAAAMAALAFTALLVGGFAAGWQWRRAQLAQRKLVDQLMMGPLSEAEQQARNGFCDLALQRMVEILQRHPLHEPTRQRLAHWLSTPDFRPTPKRVWTHNSGARKAGYSGDGKSVWVVLDDGRVAVHRDSTGGESSVTEADVHGVDPEASVALDERGTRLLTLQRDHRLVLWQLSDQPSKAPAAAWEIPGVKAMALSRGQTHWAAVTRDGVLWSAPVTTEAAPTRWEGLSVAVTNGLLSISDDGRTVSVISDAGRIHILRRPMEGDATTSEFGLDMPTSEGLESLQLAPSGDRLLCETSGWLRLWNGKSGQWTEQERIRRWNGSRVAWSVEGDSIVMASNWRGIGTWTVGSSTVAQAPLELNETFVALAVRRGPDQMAVATRDGHVLQRRSAEGGMASGSVHAAEVRSLSYSPDGRMLLAAHADGAVVESLSVNTPTENPVRRITRFRMDAVPGVASGNVILTSRAKAVLWNPATPGLVSNLPIPIPPPACMTQLGKTGRCLGVVDGCTVVEFGTVASATNTAWISPEPLSGIWAQPHGMHVLSAGASTLWAHRWDGQRWQSVGSWRIPGIQTAAFRPGKAEACLLDRRGRPFRWCMDAGGMLISPIDPTDSIAAVEFLPDASHALWVLRGRKAYLTPWGRPITSGIVFMLDEAICAHSLSENHLALATQRGVKLWDLHQPDHPLELPDPFRPIHSIAVSSANRLLAIHGANEWIRLHDITTGERIGRSYNIGRRHRIRGPWEIHFSPDGDGLFGWTTNGGVFSIPMAPAIPDDPRWNPVLIDLAGLVSEDPVVAKLNPAAHEARLERLMKARLQGSWRPQWDRFLPSRVDEVSLPSPEPQGEN